MVGYKQILCVLLFTILSMLAVAQNNTNSPYTRYGYGQLADRNSIQSRSMGGVGFGIRDEMQVNLSNPASYSAIDSLTMLVEGGFTLQNTNFSNGTRKLNAKNSSFDYVAMQFRLHPKLGVTMGLVPFSYVGYNLSSVNNEPGVALNQVTYAGDGGLQQAFLGFGYKIIPNLSIGANAYYIWGDINRKTTLNFPNNSSSIDGHYEFDNLSVSDVKFDFGLQYTHRLNKKNTLTLGAVYAPGKNLNNDASLTTSMISGGYYTNTTVKDTIADFGVPASYGFGVAYVYDNRLTVGMDYSFEKWGKEKYMDNPNSFNDRQKIALGVEFLPSHTGRNYFSYMKYRVGAYYSKPYYKIKIDDTGGYGKAKEYGVSAGLTLPVARSRSMVNLSAQYVYVDGVGQNLLDEKYIRVSIGITFNERWFFKRKVD